MRLFRPETNFCQDCFLASLIVLRAFALIILKLSKLSVVGWLLNCLRELFLLEIAVLQPSSNQGFFIRLEFGFVLGIVFSAMVINSLVKVSIFMIYLLVSCCSHRYWNVAQSALSSFHLATVG